MLPFKPTQNKIVAIRLQIVTHIIVIEWSSQNILIHILESFIVEQAVDLNLPKFLAQIKRDPGPAKLSLNRF